VTDEELAALAERLEPGARVVGRETLLGGQTCATDAVELERDGHRWSVVVRRHGSAASLDLARSEHRHLGALHTLGLPVAEPLLLDEGSLFGTPTVVMRRLSGRPVVAPDDPDEWAAQMGRTLASIHAVPPSAIGGLETVDGRLPGVWREPIVSQHPWGERAWDQLLTTPPAPAPPVIIHGDFQSTNVLWSDGRLTGVLDWTMLCQGPAGIDLGETRFEALLLLGPAVADRLLEAYEAAGGETLDDLDAWDLRGALVLGLVVPLESWVARYRDLGRTDLTLDVLQQRLDDWIEAHLDTSRSTPPSTTPASEDDGAQLALWDDRTLE
jgi:aminoglycoside phosphotransferase (APT) family kinase protein